MDFESIQGEMARHGFRLTHETKKLLEYESAGGQIAYLYKEQAFSGGVQVVVHPHLDTEPFAALDGVGVNPRFPLRSGSNLRRFPKRPSGNQGNSIHFGRSLQAASVSALSRLLAQLKASVTPA